MFPLQKFNPSLGPVKEFSFGKNRSILYKGLGGASFMGAPVVRLLSGLFLVCFLTVLQARGSDDVRKKYRIPEQTPGSQIPEVTILDLDGVKITDNIFERTQYVLNHLKI